MNYRKIYDSLIERGKTRDLDSYKERHHIVPRCVGGTDNDDNLVYLTPEEHYVAHQLLIRIYEGNYGLVKAAWMMIPNRPSNKMYGWLRRRFSEAKSIEQSGKGNSQYGTKWIHNPKTKENRKIKGEVPDGWALGKYKMPKIEKGPRVYVSDIKRQEDVLTYSKYYEIYKQVGFDKFVEITGYQYSKANLVQRCATLLNNFVPQNGKKR